MILERARRRSKKWPWYHENKMKAKHRLKNAAALPCEMSEKVRLGGGVGGGRGEEEERSGASQSGTGG